MKLSVCICLLLINSASLQYDKFLCDKLRIEIRNQQSEPSSVLVQPCYKSGQKAEIVTENKYGNA